ncbi:MAG: hypothetical protein DME01_00005, partial [Candidatus Rokuibacteriota bacterium]
APSKFTVDAFAGETFKGRIVQIRKAAQIVQSVVTYVVVVSVDNPDGILLPGMTANLKLIVAEKPSVLKIPNVALRFRPPGADGKAREGKAKTSERKDGEHKAVEPKEGKSTKGKVELRDGSQSVASSREPRVRRSRHESGRVDGRAGIPGRVWALGPDGELRSVELTLGITDGSATEVLRGDLKEGEEVVVGLTGSGGGKKKSDKSSSPRLGS